MGSTIEFTRPDGGKAPGYLAQRAGARTDRAVVMFEEWWGVTEQIRETADRLAADGFTVLVPDLYRGRVAATGDEANHLMQGLDFNDAVSQDSRGAAAYLRDAGAKKVGVMGFCMGGALAFLSAMHLRDFDAAVVFYGFPPPEAGDPGKIEIPLQGHWAAQDEFFNASRVDEIESQLEAGGVPFEFFRYEAQHGFLNSREAGNAGLGHYHHEHAETAWKRSVEFLKENLG